MYIRQTPPRGAYSNLLNAEIPLTFAQWIAARGQPQLDAALQRPYNRLPGP